MHMSKTEHTSPVSGDEGSVFDSFTNKYALSKTLRFELKPVGKTLENMRRDFEYDKDLQTFLTDQRIEDAYQTLKPIVDKYHEQFITDSLDSTVAQNIHFAKYISLRAKLVMLGRELANAQKKGDSNKSMETEMKDVNAEIEKLEKEYLVHLGDAFVAASNYWKDTKYPAPRYEWKKGGKIAQGPAILTSPELFALTKDEYVADAKIQKALDEFKTFFTYFSGFNQNRENYYETKKEAATAVATRIVYENLPKFADNVILFESKEDEYLDTYSFLEKRGVALVNKMGEPLQPISAKLFEHAHFNTCLSQVEIEAYNVGIGDANFLINLYNQARGSEEKFRRLQPFKTLYKQIGCGTKDALFFALTHESKAGADESRSKKPNAKYFSVEEMIGVAKIASRKYLEKTNTENSIDTVPSFLSYLKTKDNYAGVYWSKMAMNTISSRYFVDWSTLKEQLKKAKVFGKPDKGSEEDTKIPAVIELSALFSILDEVSGNWKEEGVFFKKSLTEVLDTSETEMQRAKKNARRREIIGDAQTPSQALLDLILDDIQDHINQFVANTAIVERLTREYFAATDLNKEEKKREWKEAIKAWIDHACDAHAMLKYFVVREGKVKGTPLDSNIANGLKSIFFDNKVSFTTIAEGEERVDWFKWRDALRNFLTKKPQDDAKENKLKLNFENAALFAGWDRDLESQRKCALFRDGKQYYLGIMNCKCGSVLADGSIPSVSGDEAVIEKMYFKQQTSVYRQLPRMGFPYKIHKDKPLLGSRVDNFKAPDFEKRRKEFGLTRDILAVQDAFDLFQDTKKNGDRFSESKLQILIAYYKKIIEIRYRNIFPVEGILSKKYTDLNSLYKDFDQVAYELVFQPIPRQYIDGLVADGSIYLFEIKSKDFSDFANGRSNNQTIYFKSVFEAIDKVNQLGANSEVFYRRQAIKERKIKAGYERKSWVIENRW